MAIDTRLERASIMSRSLPWRRTNIPFPDGGFSSADRSQLLYRYSRTFAGAIAQLGVVLKSSTKDVIQTFSGIVEVIKSTFDVR